MDELGATGSTTWMRRGVARFWSREVSLTALLAFLLLTIFVLGPLTASSGQARILTEIGFALVLVTGVFAVSRGGWFSWSFALLILGRLVFHSLVLFNPDRRLASIDVAWGLVLFCMLIPAVMAEVFRAGPITLHRIRGSIAVYLLLGMTWAFLYQLIELQLPGALRLSHPVSSPAKLTGELVYFSFVTLTSTGYGDIAPLHPLARSAAILEALTGQLFPAILLARLVSMYLADREAR